MLLHEYETTIIIRADLDDAIIRGLVEKQEEVLAANEAQLLLRDDWGKRKLAYMIKKHTKGHYVLLRVVSEPSAMPPAPISAARAFATESLSTISSGGSRRARRRTR